jgi:hypothetical protein
MMRNDYCLHPGSRSLLHPIAAAMCWCLDLIKAQSAIARDKIRVLTFECMAACAHCRRCAVQVKL